MHTPTFDVKMYNIHTPTFDVDPYGPAVQTTSFIIYNKNKKNVLLRLKEVKYLWV